jgi:hypothetical protein
MPTLPTTLPIWATGIGSTIISGLNVDAITWQSSNTIRYSFSGSPSLLSVSIGHRLVVTGATNSSNNGTFPIIAVNDTGDYIDVTNTARSDNSADEVASPATASVISTGAVIQEPSTAKKEQGWLSPEKSPDGWFNYWMNNVYLWILFVNKAFSESTPLPVITTAQRDALTPLNGWIIYNSTTGRPEYYNGTAWFSMRGVDPLASQVFSVNPWT